MQYIYIGKYCNCNEATLTAAFILLTGANYKGFKDFSCHQRVNDNQIECLNTINSFFIDVVIIE